MIKFELGHESPGWSIRIEGDRPDLAGFDFQARCLAEAICARDRSARNLAGHLVYKADAEALVCALNAAVAEFRGQAAEAVDVVLTKKLRDLGENNAQV